MLPMLRMLFVIPLFLFMVIDTNADTFSDNFDDSSWTDVHWDVYMQSWNNVTISGSDLGYQGIDVAAFALSQADNSALYSNANLTVRVDLRVDNVSGNQSNENGANLLFSLDTGPGINYLYGARVQIDYHDVTPEFTLDLEAIGTGGGDLGRVTFGSLSLGTWYTLLIQTDSNETINVYLYDDYPSSPPIGSITGVSPPLPIHSGKVAIACAGQVTFNNFYVNGTKVSSSIPTLSEWGMIIFFILLVGSAVWVIRRREGQESA